MFGKKFKNVYECLYLCVRVCVCLCLKVLNMEIFRFQNSNDNIVISGSRVT